jgi:anti-sigma-K factor RskA
MVLLALGEQAPTDAERGHLATCADCRDELDSLTGIAAIGRETREVTGLPQPPARVWDQIAAATGGPPVRTGRPAARPAPKRWARTLATAAAALVVGVVGTIGATHVVQRLNEPTVAARTTLTAYGDTPPSAHGSAELLDRNGQTALQIHVADLPPGPGYYEVWLINPANLQMISVGVLGGQSDVVLPLPSTVDIGTYRLVDVSAELYDGNSAHSGHSLLRGTL